MNEKYIKYKIKSIINKILYNKKIIEKDLYEQVSKKIDKLIFEEEKKL